MEDLVVSSTFWHGKRVLITGHTGFKGSWLALWLQKLGANVFGYALEPPSSPNMFSIARVSDGMTSYYGDVRDEKNVLKIFARVEPEIVIHMAAQSLVRNSYRLPIETYATNVMGTVNVLEAVRSTGSVRAVINVTSDKCYENREWVWGYRENERMGGDDPYSSSKGCAELVTHAYRKSFFNSTAARPTPVALASVRAGNVIGGGDWAENRLIPDFIRAMSSNLSLQIRNPNAIRPWQHVLEPLSGYLKLAQLLWDGRLEYADAWNFGPVDADAKTVGWVADELTRLWGGTSKWQQDGGEHPNEAHYLRLDISKARTMLDWSPRWTLSQTLERVVAWYAAWQQNDDMRCYSSREIDHYCNNLLLDKE